MSEPAPIDRDWLRAHPLPIPVAGSKEERGRVSIVGGSREVPGAVLLSGHGALRAGAGKLQIATAASRAGALGIALPEALVMALPETAEGAMDPACFEALGDRLRRADAVLAGPGMVEGAETRALIASLLGALDGPHFVLDAGALDGLGDCRAVLAARPGRTVLTPHAGEMANMLGVERAAVEDDPLRFAREVAAEFACVVIMKGGETIVAEPAGEAWRFTGGSIGLATSGSGDVLAGVIAGLLARGAEPVRASCWGVFLHGAAGARLAETVGPLGFLAREIAAEVPRLMRELSS